jgi:hypothetical protein
MTQLQLAAATGQGAFVADWDAIVAVLLAMDGMAQMEKIRALATALALVLAAPPLPSLSQER